MNKHYRSLQYESGSPDVQHLHCLDFKSFTLTKVTEVWK